MCKDKNKNITNHLGIIVVSYNNAATIVECLKSAYKHYSRTGTEIILVDNASSDETIALAKEHFPELKIIENQENVGFGTANNQGMHAIDAKYYFLLNSDAYARDAALYDALDYLDQHPKIAVAGIPLIFPDGSPQTAAYSYTSPLKMTLQLLKVDKIAKAVLSHEVGRMVVKPFSGLPLIKTYWNTHVAQAQEETKENPVYDPNTIDVKSYDWICGAAMVLRGSFIRETGGFDEKIFLYGEDEDLCITATQKGYEVAQLTIPAVIHEFGWGKNRKKATYNQAKHRSLKYFFEKHFAGNTLKLHYTLFILRFMMLGWRGLNPLHKS